MEMLITTIWLIKLRFNENALVSTVSAFPCSMFFSSDYYFYSSELRSIRRKLKI